MTSAQRFPASSASPCYACLISRSTTATVWLTFNTTQSDGGANLLQASGIVFLRLSNYSSDLMNLSSRNSAILRQRALLCAVFLLTSACEKSKERSFSDHP